VWHQIFNDSPEMIKVKEEELQGFLDEINQVSENVKLTLDDINIVNTGLILFGTEKDQARKTNHSFGKRSMMIDHFKEDNLEGLATLIGVRATVARLDAQKMLDIILNRLNKKAKDSKTSTTPIYGGRIEKFDEYFREAERRSKRMFGFGVTRSMIHNYGSEYLEVLKYTLEDSSLGQKIDATGVIRAEVIHAVREEMAVKLQDVVFRRTELGTGENSGRRAIEISADLMAVELGWNRLKIEDEINEVLNIFSKKGPWIVT
jgi:glycerol-3-phosphate dehydrogenase